MRDEPNVVLRGLNDSYLLIPLEGCCWLKTAGRWSWKSTPAKQCVTTVPAEASNPENGWHSSSLPMHDRRWQKRLRYDIYTRTISLEAPTSRVACRCALKAKT